MLIVCIFFNLLPFSGDFWHPIGKSFLKKLWGKEKILVASIFFPFSIMFSSLLKNNWMFLSNIYVACKCFPLSPLFIVSIMVMWESSQWLGKNIVWTTGKRNPREHGCLHRPPQNNWNNVENSVKCYRINQANAFNLDKAKILLSGKELSHSHTMTPFDAPGKQAFWKHWGKRRNCL